jgi:serine/threonine protein phosphatase PrpC
MLCCVFDGHGGSSCAEYVSTYLQTHLAKLLDKHKIHDMDKASAAFLQAWGEVENAFLGEASLRNDTSGSCAVAALVWGKEVLVAHCGDCRAVLRTSDGETIHLTRDHRATDPAEQVRIETAGGVIIEDRVYGVLAPSRSFGDRDMKEKRGVVIAEPEVVKYQIRAYPSTSKKYTFMILASDGVWDVMSSESACDYVSKVLAKNAGNADLAASKLVSMCSKYNQDDVTATVIVWLTPTYQAEDMVSNGGRKTISGSSPVTSPGPSVPSRKAWSLNRKDGAAAAAAIQQAASQVAAGNRLAGIMEELGQSATASAMAQEPSTRRPVGSSPPTPQPPPPPPAMRGVATGTTDEGAESGYESDDVTYPELQKKGLKSIFSQAKLLKKRG